MRPLLLQQLGTRLKLLREEQGLTVLEIAGATRVHKSTIYNIEAGRHPPSMKHLVELARALHCDELDLLCFPGDPRHDVAELLRRAPLPIVLAVRSTTSEMLAGAERKPPRKTRRD